MPRQRGDDGQYRSTVERDDVIGVFGTVRGPVVTSADVADELGVTRETARQKLNRLVDTGSLEKRKTAGRVVYWRVEDEETNHRPTAETEKSTILDGGELEFTRELTEARREVLEAFLRWVKTHDGGVTRGDAEGGFWAEMHAEMTGYGFESFWEASGKAALKQLEAVDKVNARTYRWRGET